MSEPNLLLLHVQYIRKLRTEYEVDLQHAANKRYCLLADFLNISCLYYSCLPRFMFVFEI